MKLFPLYLLVGLVPLFAAPGAESVLQSLNGTWRFALAKDAAAADALAKFHEESFDPAGFREIPVPANWTTHGFEEPHYVNGTKSEGFYLHAFPVPESARGKRVLLRFGGVWQSAEVWLNGKLLGRHDSGFTGFAFDASAAVLPGAENRLAVRVRQQTPLFKLDANDDWALPGIYRDVWLEVMPKEWNLESVEVVTDFDDDFRDATLRVRAFVMRNERADFFAASPPFEVRAILSREGREVQRASFTGTVTGAHNSREVPLALRIAAPAPWTAESPNLYDLRVELLRDGQVVHAWSDRIGFREISTAGGVLRLNGQAIKLRGVARHDQHPDVGRATRREHWLEDIRLMKAANINAVRTAHYPPHEGFVRLCDELGLYVIEEVPFGFGGDRMSDPSYAEGVFLRVHETVARDRNRPSVIVWSVGNEDPFSALHLQALRMVKGLDPTRPTLLPFRADEYLPPEVDILAPHYWKAEEYDRLGARAGRPVITTEYSHALGPDELGELQERWDGLTRHPAGAGAMIWAWADQGLKRPINGRTVIDPLLEKSKYTREGSELVGHKRAGPDAVYDAHGNLGADGIVDADREPQRDYWETKAVYAPVRVLVEQLDFVPGQDAIIPIRNDFDFTDLEALEITWELFRGAEVLDSGKTRLKAGPHATERLLVPTAKLGNGGSPAYVRLKFGDADGRQVALRSVRIGSQAEILNHSGPVPGLKVQTIGTVTRVTAGSTTYAFDAGSGDLASIEHGGVALARGMDLVVWRAAKWSERNQLDRRPVQHPWATYLQRMRPAVRTWKVSETAASVRIEAAVDYRYDEKNTVAVDYVYTVVPLGGLRIAYTVKPQVELEWLPEIGIELETGGALTSVEWLGWGPGSSLPNRRAATSYGQYRAGAGTMDAQDTKAGVEWALFDFGGRATLRAERPMAFRLDGEGAAQRLRLLTHVAGAWVKGGPPERPEWRLDLTEGRTFAGSLQLKVEGR
ncbi:MAG TPA: glycoside hydrolase family 2 TIM barrel-domain containing protein [Opitutaceae bacterium]|nr:glycoside hydrolase family 2 TIM barrel-domain containing protein [Opitutaceae bacterium]